MGRPKKPLIEVVCPQCETPFSIRQGDFDKRRKRAASGKVYCSAPCAGRSSHKKPTFKRRQGWTDERWEWEQKLQQEGLGMDKARTSWTSYGHEEVPPDKES